MGQRKKPYGITLQRFRATTVRTEYVPFGCALVRAQLDRVLDPDNDSVTLGTRTRAAHAVGRKLRLELV
jgi:hypothetical protein